MHEKITKKIERMFSNETLKQKKQKNNAYV